MSAFSAVVPLDGTHDIRTFDCGDAAIDEFLRESARSEQSIGLSQVYVTADNQRQVAAYFTLSPLAIRIEPALFRSLGIGDIPYPLVGGFLLGRLGVAREHQSRGLGEALVMRAAQIARRESAIVGGMFLAVDPKNDGLATWYARQDFQRLKGRRMVLPLTAVPLT